MTRQQALNFLLNNPVKYAHMLGFTKLTDVHNDWIIDMGPEGGNEGGKVVFAGTPEDLLKCKESYTAKYIKL